MHAHRSTTVKVLAAIGAVGLIPLGLAVVGSGPTDPPPRVQAAATGISTPAYVPNWIAIETGASPKITLNGPSGQVGAAQTLAAAPNCGVSLGTDADRFVTLAGSTGGAQSSSLASYQSGSIGVKEKKSGTSCYQVNAVTTESLQIGLGTKIATLFGDDAVATSAYLDVELKGGVRIRATATLDGTTTGRFELRSGPEAGTDFGDGVPVVVSECNPTPDSGADSNVSDNCRWAISGPSWLPTGDDGVVFDTLTLQALAGSFSLEGGADGAVAPPAPYSTTPNASIIEIAANTLACNAATPVEPAVGDEPSVSVYRLGNSDASTCALVPYALENGPGLARFLKSLDSQASAQFIWDIRGPVSATAGSTDLPITINYDTPDATGASPDVELGWCPNPTYAADGRFAGYTDAQIAALNEDQDDYDGIQYACLISRTAKAATGTSDLVQANDLVYVYGDATMRR